MPEAKRQSIMATGKILYIEKRKGKKLSRDITINPAINKS
jgi:hypothetical protein